ncbi:MAG: hypothetical protein H6822_31450 [Planctomycetaceae bacterium]|nr:hypothetical protein [Planctomycetales bacterium]MCB9926697.1 hypothetical protein [Planctomycetaceae bacterium]
MSRRLPCLLFLAATLLVSRLPADEAIEIGSRLELFVDDYLIEVLDGDATLVLQRPEPQEVVLVTDKPWEGNTSAYYTIFRDGELYRAYYRGSHWDVEAMKATHPEVVCYAESTDGIHWTKPELGLFEFEGSKQNNIVWNGIGTHCFAAFKDTNPDCSEDARYKGIARGRPTGKKGLYVFKSPDGIHWTRIEDEPVITNGYFDSQNLAFWDTYAKTYREYHRTFVEGVRAIMTGTSSDYVTWTEPVLLDYGDAPNQHLYTNAVQPYDRAPHILLGFPTRYLPEEGQRVEPTFMASRDGISFKRWLEPIIPEDAPEDRSGNRSNYMTWGLVQLPGKEREYSVYATEAYYTGPDSRVRRFTYRVDGFVSLRGESEGGSLVTKPLVFEGSELRLNFVASDRGDVRVELQDANGVVIEGFAVSDCVPLRGDSIDEVVTWRGRDVSTLAGTAVRVRFEVKNSDVYSFRFK